ncbi:hypothetical protein ANOM_009059 [Aspergillus nomiae NRRL 13137]|uniref:DUF202 domain-containing protein n=1 Tax=Aspergillus nomiae NRRL (strain ATCC 15546 / NRRL 13137 / CBS 260.88 / M93) TaxID=1509407 RepID=A0A0L1IUT4_ASPN3|nr:uncharacterized protein ANOM_009059 [Aspergillus nomiae NRRL 13137]KNG83249.1 hypothetical protein ANOM_009059 [Aspergillus nomiae NRRL 13137]
MGDRSDHHLHRDDEPVTSVTDNEPRPPSPTATSHSRGEDRVERDALELHEIETQLDHELNCSTPSISSGEYRITTRRTASRTSQRTERSRAPRKGLVGKIERFWTRNVVLTVPQKSNRDHFALERTFLAYIRTSVVIAMQGVLIAQLFRLQQQPSPEDQLTYYEVAIPLSVTCHCIAVIVAVLGACRFWKQQNAVALGTVYAGGWELNSIALLIALIILALFVLSIVIMVELE